MVDWVFAGQIAGIGFLTVFMVLGIMSLVLWLISFIISRLVSKHNEATTDSGSS